MKRTNTKIGKNFLWTLAWAVLCLGVLSTTMPAYATNYWNVCSGAYRHWHSGTTQSYWIDSSLNDLSVWDYYNNGYNARTAVSTGEGRWSPQFTWNNAGDTSGKPTDRNWVGSWYEAYGAIGRTTSYLSCQHIQRVEMEANWFYVYSEPCITDYFLYYDLDWLFAHEFGHAIGSGHDGTTFTTSVMYPDLCSAWGGSQNPNTHDRDSVTTVYGGSH